MIASRFARTARHIVRSEFESGTIRFIPKSPDLHDLGGYVTTEGSETSHGSGNYNFNGEANLPDHRWRAGAARGRMEAL